MVKEKSDFFELGIKRVRQNSLSIIRTNRKCFLLVEPENSFKIKFELIEKSIFLTTYSMLKYGFKKISPEQKVKYL